jgi:molybdopterin molybdotransferase
MSDLHTSGFKEVTRIAAARERLLDAVSPHERTERVSLTAADGRVLADPVRARRAVPHYARAAMDGYAVRATDTFGAGERNPEILRGHGADGDADSLAPGEAIRVHTGSELPEGADAVVMIERVEEVGNDVEVFTALAEGSNVAPVGEDVAADQHLFDAGHRLRPSDLGLLKSTGVSELRVREPPTVGVVPTGEELVQSDPNPGEVIETNGLTVAEYVRRWGGQATYREIVTDDREALRVAVQRDLTKDVVVTTGGSSVGERDLIPEVVDELGEVLVHGVALRPGHPVALGVVEETPVLMLPGYPVACIVNAVQFLRPVMKRVGGLPPAPNPTTDARLTRKIESEPGYRTFARVRLNSSNDGDKDESDIGKDSDDGGDTPLATPTRASGSGVLSSVALADGWVAVPEGREGFAEGEVVPVGDWEYSA